MVLRVLRARIRAGRVADSQRMAHEQSIPGLERTDGTLACFPGEHLDETSREFVMATLWRDLETLEGFAGTAWQTPIVTDAEVPLVEQMFTPHHARFDAPGPA